MAQRAYKIPSSVLVVIHTPELEVLLIERADKPGYWQSVTGALDAPDEPLFATARREVAEETGIVIPDAGVHAGADDSMHGSAQLRDWGLVNVYEIYPIWRHRYAPGVTHNTEHVFGLTLPHKLPVSLSPREHLASLWLPWREAAQRCFSPSNAQAILQLPRFVSPSP